MNGVSLLTGYTHGTDHGVCRVSGHVILTARIMVSGGLWTGYTHDTDHGVWGFVDKIYSQHGSRCLGVCRQVILTASYNGSWCLGVCGQVILTARIMVSGGLWTG